MITDPSYDPYDVYEFEETERLKELDDEKRKINLSLPREEQGQEVQNILVSSESKSSSPGDHGKQEEIKRKRGRPPKGR